MRIAFHGKAYSGKSSLAEYLEHNKSFHRLSFAKVLKDVVTILYDDASKNRGRLQDVGSALRNIDPDIFANYLERRINETPYKANLVIDDLRYKNEAEMLRRNGFYLVCIICDPEVLQTRARMFGKVMTEEQLNHPSENDLVDYDGFHYHITGDSPLEVMYSNLDELYKIMARRKMEEENDASKMR